MVQKVEKKEKKVFQKFLNFIEFTVFKPKWIIAGTLLCLLIIFRNSLETFLDKKLVRPYLNHINYTWIEDLIFFLLFGIISIVFINRIKRNYRINKSKILMSSIGIIVYLFYRQNFVVWDLQTLRIWNGLYYLDIFLFIWLYQLILFSSNISSKKKKNDEDGIPFILDQPLQDATLDKLKRSKDASEIVKRLSATTSEKAIAVGINGQWGFGKSSFFRLMKHEIEKDDDNIIIDFNPWRGYKENALNKDFFEALSQSIDKHSDLLKGSLKKYGDTLLDIEDGVLKSTVKLGTNLFQLESVEEQHKEINEILKTINKRFYVFIDDLDRLNSEEIVEIIKLVRNTADFYNLKFVLAYDKSYLLSALKTINSYNYENYLEKIILFEHQILPLDTEQINKELIALVELYSKPEIKEEMKRIGTDKNFERNAVANLFLLSLRDVKRFANIFIPSYNKNYSEVELIDYANVELLRFKYPAMIYQIYYKKNEFLSNGDNGILEFTYASKEKLKTVIEEYIEENKEFLQVENANKGKLIILIKALFGGERILASLVKEKSIRRDKNFQYYFKLETSANSISYNEFDVLMTKSIEIIEETFRIWIGHGKRGAIVDKLRNYDPLEKCKTQEDFEKLVKILFILSGIERNKIDVFAGYPDNDIYDKLYNTEKISKRFYNADENKYKSFLKYQFSIAKFPFYQESEFLCFVSEKNLSDGFALNQSEIEECLLKYFETYCRISPEKGDYFWALYHNCKRGVRSGNTITKEYLPEAHEIHRKFVFKNETILKQYLESIVDLNRRGNDDDELYAISNIVIAAFGGFEKLNEALKESDFKNKDYVKEFVDFHEAFANVGYKVYVPFKFKILKVQK